MDTTRVKTKTSQETEKNFTEVFRAVTEAESYSYELLMRIWQVLWRVIMELSNSYIFSLRNKRNCRTNCTSSKRRDISRIIATWIEWKVVVSFHAVLLLYLQNVQNLLQMGNLNMNEDLENHSKDRERISVEKSHGDREEFQPEETKDDEGINKDFLDSRRSSGRLLGYLRDFIYRHHIEPSISQDFCCWTKLLWKDKTNRGRDWRNFQRHHVQIIYVLCKRPCSRTSIRETVVPK